MSNPTNSYGDDPTLLKIKGESGFEGTNDSEKDAARKDYIKRVSAAILKVISKHGSAKLKAVGQAALGNAIKAVIIAKGEGAKKGLNLFVDPSFGEADFDGNVKTAYILKVVNKKE
jgi:stage V sporulation protein S